jgi:hypothetical protein
MLPAATLVSCRGRFPHSGLTNVLAGSNSSRSPSRLSAVVPFCAMNRRQVLMAGSLAWAGIALAIALAIGDANDDARLLVAVASILGPAAAVGAATLINVGHDRWAGALLLVSVATPTYAAAALNIPALVIGLVLALAPRAVLPARRSVTG